MPKRRGLDRMRDDIKRGGCRERKCTATLHGVYAIVHRPHITGAIRRSGGRRVLLDILLASRVQIRGHVMFTFYFGKCSVFVTKTDIPHEWTYTCCSLVNIWADANLPLFIPHFQRWQTQVPAALVYPKHIFSEIPKFSLV